MFSCKIGEIFKSTYLQEHLRTTASCVPKTVLVLIISPFGELIRNASEVLELTGTLRPVVTETDAIDSASNEKVFVDIVQFCCLPGDK